MLSPENQFQGNRRLDDDNEDIDNSHPQQYSQQFYDEQKKDSSNQSKRQKLEQPDYESENQNEQLSELRNELSNLPTPTRTESNFKTSTNKTLARQSTDEIQQLNLKKELKDKLQVQESYNPGETFDNQKRTQNSYYSSSKSSKTSQTMKISLLQASINAKDQLILELQEEIKQLKKNQKVKDSQIIDLQNIYEQKFVTMNEQIIKLENIVKEKDRDIDHYKNQNKSLSFQDISLIGGGKTDKQKLNDSNTQSQATDLQTLGVNFWILSAEKKMQNNNPIYSNYRTLLEAQEKIEQQRLNSQSKAIDKPLHYKQHVDSTRQLKNVNVQLPKLPEPNQQVSQIKQNLPYSKFNSQVSLTQQFTYNQRSESLQHIQKKFMNQSQPNVQQDIELDADYYFADQEIKQIFSLQSPLKKPQLDWDTQPSNFIINHKKNSSLMNVDYGDKSHIISQNISNRNLYSKKDYK